MQLSGVKVPINSKEIIPVICNANQARSVVAASFLQTLHPSLSFKSYGVNANSSTKIPQSTVNFLNKWQLPLLSSKSVNIRTDLLKLQGLDLILAADSKVATILVELGFSRNVIKIVDLVELPKELIPRDPLSLPEEKFDLELAKFIFSASMVFSENSVSKSGFSTYVPWSDFQFTSVEKSSALRNPGRLNIIVDASAQGLEIESRNLLQKPSASMRVKPQQEILLLRKFCMDPNSSIYYLQVNSASFRDLIRIRDEISIIREERSTREIAQSVITRPLFHGYEMQVKTLLTASVSNGEMTFWMPNSQPGAKLFMRKTGVPCH